MERRHCRSVGTPLKPQHENAIILGTGASTCFYNGKNIITNIPSLGFILGDEGGGDYLGKLFITEYLYGNLPQKISDNFYKKYSLSNSELMQKVYKEPYPNRFLASLCEFILDHKEHNPKYENYTDYVIRITGSVGFYFQEFIHEVAHGFDSSIDLVEKSPVTRIALYHIKH